MMNNNKILTVSYGTFSCTLEGFDDSFGTMKAIAEYFRDLASDDRYFGAEPPQPDAEMLQRIAQKEVSRRVEAREHEGKIVLSALEEDGTSNEAAALAATVAVAPVADAAAPAAQDETAKTDTSEDSAPAAQAPVADTTVDVSDAPASDVEAAETETAQTPEVETPEEVVAQAEPEVAEEDAEVANAIAAVAAPDEDENDIVPGQPDAEVEAFFDSAGDEAPAVETVAVAELVAPSIAADDSIAAKLQRIRAVVAQHDDDEEDDDYSEDEHAEGEAEAPATSSDIMADARRDIEDAMDADAEADAQLDADEEEEIDDISDILYRLENAGLESAPEDEDPETADVEDDAGLRDALENLFDDDDGAVGEANETPASDDTEAVKPANILASEGLRLEVEAAEAAPVKNNLPRARVIKVKRADLEAAIESGELEEYDDEDDAPLGLDDLAPARTSGSSLSAEDEDELARELAELEVDIEMEHAPQAHDDILADAEVDVDVAAETEIEAERDDFEADDAIAAALAEPAPQATDASSEAHSKRAKLPAIDEDQSEDMSRLLAEADHQMGEPESATRRDAFAHLRAAVAAKKADEAMGRNDDTISGDDAYRNDLADVVRPRRPVSGEARTKRPGEGRPAPLKLVAEQRIDVKDGAPSSIAPVRPRRVAALEAAAVEADGESFADFAAEMGATKLPELLEAAAAYMSFVEGHDQFSRPQLMTKVRQAGPDGFSREDTLRSFGKLLREGKIEKIKAGRFAASEDIGFRPDQRAAG